MEFVRFRRVFVSVIVGLMVPVSASAQDPHAGHPPQASPGWQLMQDGLVLGLFNHQGGPRGGREFAVPNWWMGMWTRSENRQRLSLSAMLSLDAATLGKDGYREIFQVGETLDGQPLVDRQHPHDFFMQLAASWRYSFADGTSLAISGGPAGEPTLGPVAFMHRRSAAGLTLTPLTHHTFDSTHISFGVIAAAFERKRWSLEASVFNGRDPDDERWDFDFGRLDSVAARVWLRPTDSVELQVSSGRLTDPEPLSPGNVTRTTASASWSRPTTKGSAAVTAGYGVNAGHHGRRHGGFGEFILERGSNAISGRVEFQQLEIIEPPVTVGAFALGAERKVATWKGFEGALGAQATFHRVPNELKPTYGSSPVSAQLFFRLRLPSGDMGRMWGMTMSRGHR